MKNISLVKITMAVFITTLASGLVSADNNDSDTIIPIISPAHEKLSFSALDLDNNGLLSSEETANNDLLHNSFAQIDSNSDANISQDEFTTFIKNMK